MRGALTLAALLVAFSVWARGAEPMTDAQVRQLIIQDSLRSYSGSCPCPYNVDRAGRRCGGRSAYSRPGGASPICYDNQISDSQVKRYRELRKIPEKKAE